MLTVVSLLLCIVIPTTSGNAGGTLEGRGGQDLRRKAAVDPCTQFARAGLKLRRRHLDVGLMLCL